MSKDKTNVMCWPVRGDQHKTGDGFRLFHVGTAGKRYYTEDMPDSIISIIQQHVPAATIWQGDNEDGSPVGLWGSNYVMISAPKKSISKLEEACREINMEVEHCTEEEARRGRKDAAKKE